MTTVAFDFQRQLMSKGGELDEEAARKYAAELCRCFAESPEGEALAERGGEPGHYLDLFLDYAMRYTGASPAEMDAHDMREALDVMAQKVTSKPEDLDAAIPELEAFCDFVGRAFGFKEAAEWKRAIQAHAPEFHRAVRDPSRWGMAKSMMMEGLARGRDLSTDQGINEWMRTLQAEQLARIEAERGQPPGEKLSLPDRLRQTLGFASGRGMPGAGKTGTRPLITGDVAGGEPDISAPGIGAPAKRRKQKEKARRKQAKASRRRNK